VSSDAEVGEGKLDALWKDDPGMTQVGACSYYRDVLSFHLS